MFEEKSNIIEKIGEKFGFVFSFAVFTTALYFILSYQDKLPDRYAILFVVAIALLVSLFGILIKMLLK